MFKIYVSGVNLVKLSLENNCVLQEDLTCRYKGLYILNIYIYNKGAFICHPLPHSPYQSPLS